MDKEEMIKEYGIEIAIEKISQMLVEVTEKYKKTREENLKEQLLNLIKDRDKVYNNDKDIIRKYCTK